MKTNKIYHCFVFAAILTTTGCSLMGPKCQRLKLSDIFSVKNKNVVFIEYDKDNVCRPTLEGHQQLFDLEYENPNEIYFWNYKQCKWITKSEHEQIIDDAFDSIELPVKKQQ
tara:strand:+ start:218 stop:553 length:336 start_codon:yes stop_codon:yes gene_type:complete